MLAVSWGKELYLFQCQNVEEEDGKGIHFKGYYRSKHEISHLDWLSESSILTYDTNREFKVLSTGAFKAIEAYNNEDESFDYSQAIISSQLLDPDVGYQVYKTSKMNSESRQKSPIFYTNTIVASPMSHCVSVLGYKKLYFGRHSDWKEPIEAYVNDSDWLHALAFVASLVKGTNRRFAGLPIKTQERNDLLKQYGARLVNEYISSIYKTYGTHEGHRVNDIWKTVTLIVVDFLVSVGNFNFLFKDMKRKFEGLRLQNLFMESLEAFILRNRIKHIPNEPFRDIINFYSERDKVNVLQYLMINIQMHDIDLDFAISLCMEYNLLTALFYFCCHKTGAEGPDFITPIARALSLYQKSLEEDHEENQEYGLKFLWFVHMTIKGKMFPYGAIPEEIWEEKVK